MMEHLRPTLLLILAIYITNSKQNDCSRIDYDRCVKIADPLIKEAHLVFPDNIEDIDTVCRTWNKFVDCLRKYTDRCFTDQQRRQFNKAVENPIESVHEMCMQPQYQKEYLKHAPCIKSTITEKSHCGPQYSLLVDQVAQGEIISKATLCCSHDRFKSCVHRETRRLCDRGMQDGPATKFSGQIIDKALSFLQDQCFNYIPNSGDCMSLTTDPIPFTDPLMISTAPSEIYPWSTIQETNMAKEVPPSKMTPPKQSTTWLPSSSSSLPSDTTYQTDASSTPMLGSRTRPASYGRSNSWADTSNNRGNQNDPNTGRGMGNTAKMTPTPSSKPDWATMSTWNVVQNQKLPNNVETSRGTKPVLGSTETWYPAAGSQLSNEVDEPNQQGLQYDKNGADENKNKLFSLTVVAAVLAFC